jgi:hypothetical protein
MALAAAALVMVPPIATAQGNGSSNGNRTDPQKRAQVERSQRDLDRDRLRTHDRLGATEQDRDRIQDRTKAPDDAQHEQARMYGYDLMSDAERNAYRERIRKATGAEERERIEAQHRMEMQIRAKNRNMELDEAGKPVREE